LIHYLLLPRNGQNLSKNRRQLKKDRKGRQKSLFIAKQTNLNGGIKEWQLTDATDNNAVCKAFAYNLCLSINDNLEDGSRGAKS
jgi:hypothetical protein